MLELLLREQLAGRRVVDVGAGEGYFSQLVGEQIAQQVGAPVAEILSACDLYPENFRYAGVRCQRIDASDALPYTDASIDAACAVEVVEHLENQFRFVRELYRILKPGGRAIVSTPNLLNMNSRLRFLHSGFWLLFNPLPLERADPIHTAGHIHPITPYYLMYAFYRAGFRRVEVHADRTKRSAALWTFLLAPILFPAHWLARARFRGKQPAVAAENAPILDALMSWPMLTSRSAIIEARK